MRYRVSNMQRAVICSDKLSDQQVLSLNTFVDNFYRLTDHFSNLGIVSLREHVWPFYLTQKHVLEQVTYTQKPVTRIESREYRTVEAVLFGAVTTISKFGVQQSVEWAGRADYVTKNDMEWKIWRYQVYVVSCLL